MKRISQWCKRYVSVVALTLLCLPVLAQRVPQNYTMVTFHKVAPENVDAFVALMKGDGKKVAQARIASGGIKGWSLLKVTAPYAIGADANYAAVTYSSSYPNLDPSDAEIADVFQKAGVNRQEYGKKLRQLSTRVSQQISRTILRVGPSAEIGDFIKVDYHLAPHNRSAELIDIEQNVYAPMFKTVIDEGKGPRTWSLSTPVLPLASESGFSFYTTQIFKDNAALGRGLGLGQDLFRKVHPNRNYMSTMQHVRELDSIVKVRIYRVLDMAGSPVLAR